MKFLKNKKRFCKGCTRWCTTMGLCGLETKETKKTGTNPITGCDETETVDKAWVLELEEYCRKVLKEKDPFLSEGSIWINKEPGRIFYRRGAEKNLIGMHHIINHDNKCKFYRSQWLAITIIFAFVITAFSLATIVRP